MQHDRLGFVLGPELDPEEWSLDDPDERHALALERLYGLPIGFGAMSDELEDAIARVLVEVFASILDDDASEAWAAAERGLDAGLEPDEVLAQIFGVYRAEVVAHALRARNPDVEIPDRAAHLVHLPFAPRDTIREWLADHVRAHGPTPHDALLIAAAAAFGRPDLTIDDADLRFDAFRDHLERVVDGLMGDADGIPDRWSEFTYADADSLVHVPTLHAGMVLTTRVASPADAAGMLPVEVDLAGFLRVPTLSYDGFPILQLPGEKRAEIRWLGRVGWLDPFAGSLVAVRVDDAGVISMERLDHEPAADTAVVDALAAACRAYTEVVDQAADMDDILVQMRIADPTVLSTPQPPLRELAAAAGLDQRDQEFADTPRLFRMSESLRRHGAIQVRVHDPFLASEIDLALTHISRWQDEQDGIDYGDHQPPPADLQVLLRSLGGDDPPAFLPFIEQWYGQRQPLSPAVAPVAQELADVAEAASAVARRGRQQAVAQLLACCAQERLCDPAAAEAHLHLAAEADPGWAIVTDRLAWYAMDRGDLSRAVKLWRSVGPSGRTNRSLAVIERATSGGADGEGSAKLGRNDACWCGSGRKYKQCHLGQAATPSLPDRVPLMIRKFAAFIESRGTDALVDLMDLAEQRAESDRHEDIAAAMADPLVLDVVLTATEWGAAFLAERGALLPDDERLLLDAWALRERSVFEVEAVRPGDGVSVRDVRTGDRFDVRERTFSTGAAAGMHVLSRVVPDGETNQFVGGIVAVPVGYDAAVIGVLDSGNPYELLGWVGDLFRPRAPQNREGEEMMACELELLVDAPEATARFLDGTYERMTDEEIAAAGADGAWVEFHEIADGERLVRAGFLLEGELVMVRTNSDERAERILHTLLAGLAAEGVMAELTLDEREPLDLRDLASFALVPTMWDDDEDFDDVDGDAADGLDLRPPPSGSGGLGPRPTRSSMGLTLPGLGGGPGGAGDDSIAAAMEQIQTQMEDRWCAEEVPALGGVTPRQAAADPTRRPDLIRLIESFERMPVPEGAITFRPERLRKVLGL